MPLVEKTSSESVEAVPEPSPAAVLEIIQALARELRPGRKAERSLTLDASLERDLGLDSLGRVELLSRLERAFGVTFPEQVLSTAETPRDLLRALAAGGGSAARNSSEDFSAVLEAAEAAPDRTRTLVEVLEWHAGRHSGRRHILLLSGEGDTEELTYGDLLRRSRAVAAGLAGLGVRHGNGTQAVGLMLPTSLDYFAAFFGAQIAGGIPVPLYPPARKSQIEDHLRRQAGILKTAGARVLVTFPEVLPLARLLSAQLPGLRVATVAALSETRGAPPLPPDVEVREDDVAFLQFTSGSTGNPKGVVLTHANLLANLRAIGVGAEIGAEDVVVSWLPLYHDMGLIGCWMASLYFGMPLVLMSPLTFLARPSRWLWAIHRYRGTLSAAPNFAFELCVAKVPDEEIEGLDLSSWRMALNGAEPVSPDAMHRFIERYDSRGFSAGAMSPVYGLAENSLAVAFPPLGRPPVVDAVEREPFQRSGRAVPAAPDEPHALRFPSCGFPLVGHEIRIVDSAGREVGERQEGRLEFRGPSATSGYFDNSEATARLLRGDGWLDSGDRAYVAAGEVYITGRVKDVIIRAGRNLYPHELEGAVAEIPGIRKGCVAVFGSPDPRTGTERLVILAETRERTEEERERLREAIQGVAVELLGSPADDVVLAPPHGVPKTSSGKIRRTASRELYESGRIGTGGAALGWQLARLAASGLRAQLARRARTALDALYSGRVYGVLALAALPIWLGVVLLPGVARRRRFACGAARLLARAAGIPLRAEGFHHLGGEGPRLVASNHQSYLDGIVLTAMLPPEFGYVVKRELENHAVARVFLSRLGTLFVERFDPAQGVGETRKALDAVKSGASLVVFPEGTFRRYPGLLPFRLGTFTVAADAGVSVVPVVIRGTRTVLRGDDRFFRRGEVTVTAAPPVHPQGTGWAEAVRLRDTVRAEILARCGEPDLGD